MTYMIYSLKHCSNDSTHIIDSHIHITSLATVRTCSSSSTVLYLLHAGLHCSSSSTVLYLLHVGLHCYV
jgi:hypothetical protein